MAWQAVILHQFGWNCNMSILTTISNCTEKLFENHRNYTICSLVNFFTIVISMYCGTLMSKEKDWYQWGEKSCIIPSLVETLNSSTFWQFILPTAVPSLNQLSLLHNLVPCEVLPVRNHNEFTAKNLNSDL